MDRTAFQAIPSEAVVFDRDGVLRRMMGDHKLAKKVAEAFSTDMPRQIEMLREFLARGQAEGTRRQVHSINGAAATMGGERLRELAALMEEAASTGDLGFVSDGMAELERQFFLLRDALQA